MKKLVSLLICFLIATLGTAQTEEIEEWKDPANQPNAFVQELHDIYYYVQRAYNESRDAKLKVEQFTEEVKAANRAEQQKMRGELFLIFIFLGIFTHYQQKVLAHKFHIRRKKQIDKICKELEQSSEQLKAARLVFDANAGEIAKNTENNNMALDALKRTENVNNQILSQILNETKRMGIIPNRAEKVRDVIGNVALLTFTFFMWFLIITAAKYAMTMGWI